MPAMQETAYYEPPTAQPVPEPTESAQAQGEKVDTVEFAIAPHPEEPEEAEPAPIPVEEPAIDETRSRMSPACMTSRRPSLPAAARPVRPGARPAKRQVTNRRRN